MAIIAFALPILQGKTEEARSFGADLDAAGLREHYEELNRLARVGRHYEWIESVPSGDLLVVVFEADDPSAVARGFSGGDVYDDWWRRRVQRIHGFDPGASSAIPQLAWSWEADEF